jgi:hypothetical protein
MQEVPTADPDSHHDVELATAQKDRLAGLGNALGSPPVVKNHDEDLPEDGTGDEESPGARMSENLYRGSPPWMTEEKFETAYAFDYVEESLGYTGICGSILRMFSRSRPTEPQGVLNLSEKERRVELYSPLVSDESQDGPQPLPFFGENFYKEFLGDLWVRILFVVPFWAMMTYDYYFLSLVWVLGFFAIFKDQTKYRHFLSAESRSESFVMEYIRKLQSSPIAGEGSDAPYLLVEEWHAEGGDVDSDGTPMLDYHEHYYLKHALKVKYTGSTEAEEGIRRAQRKIAEEKKALAIESTFSVEIDPDLEKMMVSKLKDMKSKCAEEFKTRKDLKRGSSGKAFFVLRPNNNYTKVMLNINNARDAQEPRENQIKSESPEEDSKSFYLDSPAAYAQYYSVRLVFGPALANRLFICSKTLHYRVDFKVKISPTGLM